MTIEEKLKLIESVGEEIIEVDELKELLESGKELVAYDGFEPSGQMHIAQGVLRAININKMTRGGVKFKMLVADWHALANKKLGGDLEKIQTVGKYFIEVWRACGMDMKNVEFVWASDLVKDPNYWMLVLRVAATNSYKRFIRTAEIMGRAEDENITGAQIIYSCMQTADIFTLGAKITQLGLDQRKVNVLAREVGPQLGFWKPVIVSHHMLMGLNPPTLLIGGDKKADTLARVRDLKMSKSDPNSAIYMTDSEEDLIKKINKAYCPEGQTDKNPVLEYCRYIIFELVEKIEIERQEKFGGNFELKSYEELEKHYSNKKIHPLDLKNAVGKHLNKILEPVRRHFEENKEAKKLLEEVRSYQITR